MDSDLGPFLEQDDGLETEPDYFASGGESQMSSLLDSDSSPGDFTRRSPYRGR